MVRGWDQRGIPIINFFGSNEGVALVSDPATIADPEERARFFPRPAVPGVEVRLVTPHLECYRAVLAPTPPLAIGTCVCAVDSVDQMRRVASGDQSGPSRYNQGRCPEGRSYSANCPRWQCLGW
jgi:hypothetical protein